MAGIMDFLNSPQAQPWTDMIQNISPQQRLELNVKQQQMDAYTRGIEAEKRLGQVMQQGGLTDDAIREMWAVSPEYAMKLMELKRKQDADAANQMIYDPSIPLQTRMQMAARNKDAVALDYLQMEAEKANRMAGFNAPQGVDIPSGQPPIQPSGQEFLSPIPGLDSVPAEPTELETPDALLKQMEDLRKDPAIAGSLYLEQQLATLKDKYDRAVELEKRNMESSGLTKGQEALDEAFAKDYAKTFAAGGIADMQKNLDQLKGVRDELMSAKSSVTGGEFALIPSALEAVVAPKATDLKDRVEEVVQRNLREVLGAQFTEKEGEKLIARAYNQKLPEQENINRLNRLINQIDKAYAAKIDAARYFEANGTLKGWQGKLPSITDFNESVDSSKAGLEDPLGIR